MLLLPAGEPVRADAVGTEAGEHRGVRQLGERAERAEPQAAQHAGQRLVAQGPDRPRREERRRLARRDDHAAPGREPGRERAVGDPGAGVHDPFGDHRLEHLGDERVVTAEVARRSPGGEREHPGTIDHQARGEALDRARHRLERARVGRRDRSPRW